MKFHPLLRLVFTQPQLLAEHAKAYTSLVSDEVSKLASISKKIAVLGVAALCFGLISAVLSGVGLMLWAVIIANEMKLSWALLAAPLIPGILCAYCSWLMFNTKLNAFSEISNQIAEDINLIREGGSI